MRPPAYSFTLTLPRPGDGWHEPSAALKEARNASKAAVRRKRGGWV